MSQYYPPQGPMYPPEQGPEEYYDDGDYEYIDDSNSQKSLLQTSLAFIAGGCLVFICIGACLGLGGFLWILDPGGGAAASAPAEGSDIGLSFDEPAYPQEPVINDLNMQVTVMETNRNASLESLPPVQGRETIIVTIELVNAGEEEANFNERDFLLVNSFEEVYEPAVGAVTGALGRGTLPPNEGLEGRLVYEVIEGEVDLRLLWDVGRDSQPRYIYIE
ncbi:MAG: DUF4352 domain-containing protein [Anaerolineae bacterium]|nr:DUF4352 domain-containing protein [Anaerolineae bacterium]